MQNQNYYIKTTSKTFFLINLFLILGFLLFTVSGCGGGGSSNGSVNSGLDGGDESDVFFNLPEDRVVNWNPGVFLDQNTQDGIPVYPVEVNVIDFGAVGDGIEDDTAAIQDAVDSCSLNHAVYFTAGKYKLSGKIKISKSIVLRGEIDPVSKRPLATLFNYSTGIDFTNNYNLDNPIDISSGYTKESTNMIIPDTSGLSAGDYVLTDQLNDGNVVTIEGVGGSATWSSRENGTRCLGQINKIIAVNTDTNTITIETPLYHTYSADLNPQIVKINNVVENAGVESLKINGIYSKSKNNITLSGVTNCWIKNVESANADRAHIKIMRGYQCEIRDSYIHHQRTGYASLSYGIEFFLQSTANLIENNIFYHMRSPLMIAGGLTGTVFGYNYSSEPKNVSPDTLSGQGGLHGGHPNMILFEGNLFHKMGADSYWGSNAHVTIFRNQLKGQTEGTTTGNGAIDIQSRNKYINIVGNVLGTDNFNGFYECSAEADEVNFPELYSTTFNYSETSTIYKLGYNSFGDGNPQDNDPAVLSTLLRHGNYDYVTNSVIYDQAMSSQTLPDSLYYQTKPAFFGNLSWPAIRPDSTPMISDIPAKLRFETMIASDTMSPMTPPDFEIINVNSKSATINWCFAEEETGMDQYEIYRDGDLVRSTIYEGPWKDISLTPETTYTYTIKARDYAGNADNESDPVQITTLPLQNYDLNVINGSGSGNYTEGISTTIKATDRISEGYTFQQWVGDVEDLSSAWWTSPAATLWNHMEVVAIYKKTDGNDTEAPQPPPSFRATEVTDSIITLVWEVADDDAGTSYYQIYFEDSTTLDDWTREKQIVVTNLSKNTHYSFKVRAVDIAGNKSDYAYLTVSTLAQ